jgi:multidrug efflux pump subunit AcrB
VVGGLVVSTVFTMLLVPVLFEIVMSFRKQTPEVEVA